MIARQAVAADPLLKLTTLKKHPKQEEEKSPAGSSVCSEDGKISSGETSFAASFVFVESAPAPLLTRHATVIRAPPTDTDDTDEVQVQVFLLNDGEEKQALVPKVGSSHSKDKLTTFSLMVTQFRIALFSTAQSNANALSIPLPSILDIKSSTGGIDVKLKDCRFYQFYFHSDFDCHKKSSFLKLLSSLVFDMSPSDFFPMSVRNKAVSPGIYCPARELERWNLVSSCCFTVTKENMNYSLCCTYPKLVIVPSDLPNSSTLEGASKFRDKGRFPVLSWASNHTGSIWRSAQPKASLLNRSLDDEEYLKKAQVMFIIDCRPMLNAYANIANGAGVEALNNYHSGIELVFAGIQNIHHVRDSWENMFCMSQKFFDQTSGPWFSQLETTGWYDHICSILRASRLLVDKVKTNINVLCRCSHGLDRTPQVVSLAMLALDPFYRTIRGFCVLIEKEWIAMGHKFHSRNCLGRNPSDEFSPIFTQWLECVFQIISTHPDSFEFKTSFLLAIQHAMVSGRFGNFLFDCEKDRIEHGIVTVDGSVVQDVWAHLLSRKEKFINWNFSHRNIEVSDTVLEIDTRVSQIKVWNDLWFSLQRVL